MIPGTAAIRPTVMAVMLPPPQRSGVEACLQSSKFSSISIYKGQILVTAEYGNPHEPLDVGLVAGDVKHSPSFSQRAQNALLCRQVTADYTGTGARVLF